MADVFISYSSFDDDYAKRIVAALEAQHISTWYAPVDVKGGDSFAKDIGEELSGREETGGEEKGLTPEDIKLRLKKLGSARVLLMLLSKAYMGSAWAIKEMVMAVNKGISMLAVLLDHEPIPPDIEYTLSDVQRIDCRRSYRDSIALIVERIREKLGGGEVVVKKEEDVYYTEDEIGIRHLDGGDPYYEGKVQVEDSGESFFLAPPADAAENEDGSFTAWVAEKKFAACDEAFGMTLSEAAGLIPIPDLLQRIEESRKKIFGQFCREENGCYYNNKKYGIESISRFARTEDDREKPKQKIRVFTTDYFTHRVMKDVCKKLVAEKNSYIDGIDCLRIGDNRLFFTSLGINLVLTEDQVYRDDWGVLITSRSVNASETYRRHLFALSVIEGVSISDGDSYTEQISLPLAAERGLIEELGIDREYIKTDSLKFYDLFVNRRNLEIGISCSVELKRRYRIEDIIPLRGKDERLEIADKKKLCFKDLKGFLQNNAPVILPQALYVFSVFLDAYGIRMIDRYRRRVWKKQSFVRSQEGTDGPCGDRIVEGKDFIAVISSETPKDGRLWGEQRGDVFAASVLADAVMELDPHIDARNAVERLNDAVKKQYELNGIRFDGLAPEDRLQASVLVYSAARREIWSFGDCLLRISQRNYRTVREGDRMLSDLRAFCIEAADMRHEAVLKDDGTDRGREQILPFLGMDTLFANSGRPFGYDVINGGPIHAERVKIYPVQPGDHIVMASGGYPQVFDTLEKTEEYLQNCIREDPMCIGIMRRTEGIRKGYCSYSDRCYISFTVESEK